MAELGYDVYENKDRSYEMDGITGVISRFLKEDAEYPLMIIDMTSKLPSKAKISLLSTLFIASTPRVSKDSEDGAPASDNGITIYSRVVKDGKEILPRMGKISPSQVKSFLRIFTSDEDSYNIEGYLTKDRKLEGNYLYVFSE